MGVFVATRPFEKSGEYFIVLRGTYIIHAVVGTPGLADMAGIPQGTHDFPHWPGTAQGKDNRAAT